MKTDEQLYDELQQLLEAEGAKFAHQELIGKFADDVLDLQLQCYLKGILRGMELINGR